jgi:hypothetical protein
MTAGCGGSGGTSEAAPAPTATVHKPEPRKCRSYKGFQKPQTCIASTGVACNTYFKARRPTDCLSRAELRAKKAAQLAAAKARAARRAKARARAAATARERAAEYAAANAWHAGYNQQDDNVYWKWVNGRSCEEFAQYGCWHVEVITAYGCSSYVAVHANEYSGSAIINELLDNQGSGIPPKTPRLFELDADEGANKAGDVQIDCS